MMTIDNVLEDQMDRLEKTFEEGEYCKGCIHNEVTKDPYGTGDSPPLRECMASMPDECPGV